MDTLTFASVSAGDIPIRVDWHKSTSDSIATHAHEFFEMIFIVSGKGIHEVDSECFDMMPGDVFLVPPYVPHSYRKRQNAEIINLIFDHTSILSWSHELFSDSCNNLFQTTGVRFKYGQTRLDGNSRNQIINQLHLMAKYQSGNSPGKKLNAISDFFQLCRTLAGLRERSPCHDDTTGELVARIVAYMEQHYKQPLSISMIARRNGVSMRTLQRMFQNTYQCSPVVFLNQLRLEKSTDLLLYTSLKITEIAEDSGFSDSNYYCKLFTRKYRISPRNYRGNVRNMLPV